MFITPAQHSALFVRTGPETPFSTEKSDLGLNPPEADEFFNLTKTDKTIILTSSGEYRDRTLPPSSTLDEAPPIFAEDQSLPDADTFTIALDDYSGARATSSKNHVSADNSVIASFAPLDQSIPRDSDTEVGQEFPLTDETFFSKQGVHIGSAFSLNQDAGVFAQTSPQRRSSGTLLPSGHTLVAAPLEPRFTPVSQGAVRQVVGTSSVFLPISGSSEEATSFIAEDQVSPKSQGINLAHSDMVLKSPQEKIGTANRDFKFGRSGIEDLTTSGDRPIASPQLSLSSEKVTNFASLTIEQSGQTTQQPPAAMGTKVSSQISASVAQAGEGTYEINLSPAELGRVRMSIQVQDNNIVLVLSAERVETTDLIRRQIDQLASEFKSQGFSGVSVSVSGGGSQQSEQHGGSGEPFKARTGELPSGAEPDHKDELQTLVSISSGIDLKL